MKKIKRPEKRIKKIKKEKIILKTMTTINFSIIKKKVEN